MTRPTQATAARLWWAHLDELDRPRVLRGHADGYGDGQLLARNLALATGVAGLVGVTVAPADRPLVDGRLEGRCWPTVFQESVAGVSREETR